MAHPQQFLLNPQHWFPPPQQPFPPADFQELAKAAALRSNNNHLAIPVRLANSSQADHTNSTTVVRSLIKRFDLDGKLVTVAENVRKWMEEDNPEWLVQIGRRVGAGYITKDGKASFLLLYGDGFETLLLLDGVDPPQDLSKVPTIGISASFAPAVGDMNQETAAKQGLLEPSDSLWEHVNFEFNHQGNDRSLVLHTSSRVSMRPYDDMHRKRVIRVWTVGSHRSTLGRIERDAVLESQWKQGWRGSASKTKMPAAASAPGAWPLPAKKTPAKMAPAPVVPPASIAKPAPASSVANGGKATTAEAVNKSIPASKPSASTDALEVESNHTVLTFKPRELVVLERAFDDSLTDADLKANCELWGDDDFKAAFNICKTLGLRWAGIEAEKKRKSEAVDGAPAKKPRGRPKAATKSKTTTPAAPAADASNNSNGASASMEVTPKESAKPPSVKILEAEKSKDSEKLKEAEKLKESENPKGAEKPKATPTKAKPQPKPKKTDTKIKTEDFSSSNEGSTKKPETPAEKSSPVKNVLSAMKKEEEKEAADDEDEKPAKTPKSPGRPKGSKNKPKDEKDEKKSAAKATGTKSKPKTTRKAAEGKK